jgi:exostosin family protein
MDLACALGVGGFPPQLGPKGPEEGKNDRLNREAKNYFEAVDADRADVFVFCYHAHNHRDEVLRISADAARRGVPCVFLSWGDADEPIDLPHGVLLRHSLFRRLIRPCERAMPAFCSDPLAELGQRLKVREKSDVPSVGFCGYVGHRLARAVYRLSGRTEKARGLELRAASLASLGRIGGIKTDFVTRNSYWAGAAKGSTPDLQIKFQARAQFLENLMGNDYTLCIRGAGNFSYRLYETLAAGRIPLFINTECVLPMEDRIDWKNHCVWVEEGQLPVAGEIVKQFHARLSGSQFEDMQKRNRALWEQKLNSLDFYREFLGVTCRKIA